jgi:hypothetical protein
MVFLSVFRVENGVFDGEMGNFKVIYGVFSIHGVFGRTWCPCTATTLPILPLPLSV